MPSTMTPSPPRRRSLPWAALGLAAALLAFAVGVVHLFQLRFSLGDVYPPYSTLRADPLGAEVFFDALAGQPGLGVERNLRPLNLLGKPPFGAAGRDAVLDPSLACFYLGADANEWPFLMDAAAAGRLETILRRGGRVIVTFLPVTSPLTPERLVFARRANGDPSPGPSARPGASPSSERRHRPDDPTRPVDLVERWALDFRRVDLHAKRDPQNPAPTVADHAHATAVGGARTDGDPAPVSWHSLADFDLAPAPARAAGWTVLYACGGRPVIVARPFGGHGGELILAADSYFLSNEGLRAEPHAALLADLVGPCRRVIFDENHLGLREEAGLMTLARRYRLQGALAALGLLAGLFVWRNVVSLVPRGAVEAADRVGTAGEDRGTGTEAGAVIVTGRDSAAGFLNLLRRGVPARDLPAVCLAQWEHAPTGAMRPGEPVLERLRVIVRDDAARPARQRSPAGAYRAMCAALRAGRRG